MSKPKGAAFFRYSDRAHRCSEAVNLHIHAIGIEAAGKWVAIRMEDGGSDGVLYDRKQDAVRHQLHEQYCCYVRIPPDGMSPAQAERFIAFNRALYSQGARLIDPDKDTSIHIPQTYAGGPNLHGR
jgi:hypothetical protein